MKSFKYFLALPLALTGLVACGNKDNFKKISYKSAKEIAENYGKSISNSKATDVTVSGYIDKINVKGDMTWWSYHAKEVETKEKELRGKQPEGGGEVKPTRGESLLSMIPNFSIKNGEINVDSQDIVSFSMPGAIMGMAETILSGGNSSGGDVMSLALIDNLPKFPMNTGILKILHGFEFNEEAISEEGINWDLIDDEKEWEKAKTYYFSDNGRLKITVETKDIEGFVEEVKGRVNPQAVNDDPEPTKVKYPATFSITTNKVGYIDSASVNLKVKGIDKETQDSEIYYLSIKGDLEINLSLHFEQKFAEQIVIKYQMIPYHIAGDDEVPDIYYNMNNHSPYGLVKDTDDIIGPTTSLKKLSNYLNFEWNKDWYNGVYDKKYDIPFFNENYWHRRDKDGKAINANVAYTDESYDVIAVPKIVSNEQTCLVLGAQLDGSDTLMQSSYVVTSNNGRKISSQEGIGSASGAKLLLAAADVTKSLHSEASHLRTIADEIFINSSVLKADGSEYIVSIPVLTEIPSTFID